MHNWRSRPAQSKLFLDTALQHQLSKSLSTFFQVLSKTVVRCNWIAGEGPMHFLWKPQITCFHFKIFCQFVCFSVYLFVYQTCCFVCVFNRSEGPWCKLHKGASWAGVGWRERGNVRSYVSPTHSSPQPPGGGKQLCLRLSKQWWHTEDR